MNYGMATVCPSGYRVNKKWRRRPGQRQCLKEKGAKPTLKDLQRLAKENDVSIFKRRKDGMGFTKTPLSMKALKYRLTKMNVPYAGAVRKSGGFFADLIDLDFGMATVCPPGKVPNPFWKGKRGQRQCVVRVKSKPKTLKQLQRLARKNEISIYQRRKDDMGFTRKPLSIKALKYRLTKMRVPY